MHGGRIVSAYDCNQDIIDVRDIIDAVEDLRTEGGDTADLATLEGLLADLRGNGGDEQWQGDWYPAALIRDSHFVEYAQQLAEDIGAINPSSGWPTQCIDWDRAARDLQMDYTTVEYDGILYWYR